MKVVLALVLAAFVASVYAEEGLALIHFTNNKHCDENVIYQGGALIFPGQCIRFNGFFRVKSAFPKAEPDGKITLTYYEDENCQKLRTNQSPNTLTIGKCSVALRDMSYDVIEDSLKIVPVDQLRGKYYMIKEYSDERCTNLIETRFGKATKGCVNGHKATCRNGEINLIYYSDQQCTTPFRSSPIKANCEKEPFGGNSYIITSCNGAETGTLDDKFDAFLADAFAEYLQ